jgi:polyphosphate kinase
VFYFRSGDKEDLYLSSADWMNRNMMRRIEIAWPVKDAKIRQRVIDECLVAYLYDTSDAWLLDSDGYYQRQPLAEKSSGLSAQSELMKRYKKAH